MVNATGDGQGTRSKAGTSAAASGVSSNWPAASIEVTDYAPTTAVTVVSAWPAAGIEITTYTPSTGNSIASSWPSASVEVTSYVPTTVITVGSSWPVAATEVTAYVPTTAEGGSDAWTSWMTAGTVAIDGANTSDAWDPTPTVSTLGSADASTANLFLTTLSEHTEGVFATNFGFDTGDIPSSSTINGIEVRFVDVASNVGDKPWTFSTVYLTADGSTNDGTAKTNQGTINSSTASTVTVPASGGATDAWGTALTDTEVRASTFGVFFNLQATSETNTLAVIDQLELRVNYT